MAGSRQKPCGRIGRKRRFCRVKAVRTYRTGAEALPCQSRADVSGASWTLSCRSCTDGRAIAKALQCQSRTDISDGS